MTNEYEIDKGLLHRVLNEVEASIQAGWMVPQIDGAYVETRVGKGGERPPSVLAAVERAAPCNVCALGGVMIGLLRVEAEDGVSMAFPVASQLHGSFLGERYVPAQVLSSILEPEVLSEIELAFMYQRSVHDPDEDIAEYAHLLRLCGYPWELTTDARERNVRGYFPEALDGPARLLAIVRNLRKNNGSFSTQDRWFTFLQMNERANISVTGSDDDSHFEAE